jgi:hypothetical protein
MRSHGKVTIVFADARFKQMEMSMPENRTGRIIKLQYDEITRVVDFRIFVVQPDGKETRVFGGGAFEEQDLDRIGIKLIELANDFAIEAAEVEAELEAELEAEPEAESEAEIRSRARSRARARTSGWGRG